MGSQNRGAAVALTIAAVIIASGSLGGCRGGSAEAVAKGLDELAGRAAARAAEHDGAAAASKIEIKARVKTALSPVERLSDEEMLGLVEHACTAKDLYDL